jgi:hypothetical protein
VHYNTLLRVVTTHGWLAVKKRTDVRKAFEVDHVNDLLPSTCHPCQIQSESANSLVVFHDVGVEQSQADSQPVGWTAYLEIC